MKTIKHSIYTGLIALSLVFAGCSSDDDGGDGGNAAPGTMSAKVNGANFNSGAQFTSANQVNAGGSTTLTILGSDMSGKAINLIINGFDGTGTYEIGSGVGGIAITASYIETNIQNPANSQTWQAPYEGSGVAGEINFSEAGDTVVGTFSFTAKNSNDNSTKEITQGAFNVEVTTF